MNSSSENSSSSSYARSCRNWEGPYHQENYISTMASIILNMLTCPMTVFINALVIVAVMKKRRLQTTYNILLACLAATDLVVGVVIQPSFIFGELSLSRGSSITDYCRLFRQTIFFMVSPSVASLLLLALLSIERYVAIKYSLRYMEIVTKCRIIVAVIFCWTTAIIPSVLVMANTSALRFASAPVLLILGFVSFSVIIYCHIFVFLVTRRHRIQIQAEQVSQEAKKKFLEDKKAAKTTSIIIGMMLFSYVPITVYPFVKLLKPENYFANLFVRSVSLLWSCVLINSLCNPIIYCWRSSVLRKGFIELLRRNNNVERLSVA